MNRFEQSPMEEVTSFKGIQVTGITMSEDGRMFVNFPRWRDGVPFSVAEVLKDGNHHPYPNREMNTWENGNIVSQAQLSAKLKYFINNTCRKHFVGRGRVVLMLISVNKRSFSLHDKGKKYYFCRLKHSIHPLKL